MWSSLDEVTRVGSDPIRWCPREGTHVKTETREDGCGDGRDAAERQESLPPWEAGGGEETPCAAFQRQHRPAPEGQTSGPPGRETGRFCCLKPPAL